MPAHGKYKGSVQPGQVVVVNSPKKDDVYRNGSNLITVFTDASFREGWAGFSVWARSSEKVFTENVPILFKVPHIGEAECIALAHGIESALTELSHEQGVIVVAQSDSVQALGIFVSLGAGVSKKSDVKLLPNNKGTEKMRKHAKRAMEVLALSQGQLWLKHVRGHTNKDEPRSYVNKLCDAGARKARLEAEKKVL